MKCDCGTCRTCKNRAYARTYRERHPDRVAETRERFKEAHPEAQAEASRRYRETEAGKANRKLHKAKWRKTERGRATNAASARRRRAEDPETFRAYDREVRTREDPAKMSARWAVKAAIQKGELVPQPCEICGAENVHAHHPDYTRPLDVRWLCPVHHKAAHKVGG